MPTHTANSNRRQIAQHFAPAIPGAYEPPRDYAHRNRSNASDAVRERERLRALKRRSTDDVWLDGEGEDGEGEAELHVSEARQECGVCFEPLCKERTAVFVDEEGKRTCGHFLHERCARCVVEHVGKWCPLCRTECAEARGVPFPTENAEAWFKLCDVQGDGTMDKSQLIAVIRTQIPVDWKRIAKDMNEIWPRFDRDGTGVLTKEQLIGEDGLLAFVSKKYPARLREYRFVPHVADKEAWFRFWDEDESGTLEKDEVVRALIKSFDLKRDVEHIQEVRSVVENIWCIFDIDDTGGIDLTEFMLEDGLGDSIIAAFAVDKRVELDKLRAAKDKGKAKAKTKANGKENK